MAEVTQVSTDSADPRGQAGQAGQIAGSRAYGALDRDGPAGLVVPAGPGERGMRTGVRRLAWGRVFPPQGGGAGSGLRPVFGLVVGGAAPDLATLWSRL